MKKIINQPENFVDEVIDGVLSAHSRSLRSASADRRAIVRADAPRAGKVGIITGGGSGHLPVFMGYVGSGLLDGVAIGNVFSSPSSTQISDAIRAVDGGAGVLLLYGNYGGDVYNFDIAADLVAADGIVTATVLATDDVASAPLESRSTRRGVAGMVYAFKIAGAAAERGDTLDEVTAVARKVAERTVTMGVGLSPTILPAAGEPTFTLRDGEMELGIGIHGEPGIERSDLATADEIADRILDSLLAEVVDPATATVSVLVNGLGATPLEELYVLYRRVAARLAEIGTTVHAPLIGNYVTSLEMAGASISILPLDDELRELLDAPAASPFVRFGTGELVDAEPTRPASDTASGAGLTGGGSSATPTPLATFLLQLFERLPQHADELRDLDAALGDGDLGITVSAGAQAAAMAVEQDPAADDQSLVRAVGAAFSTANPSTFAALVGGGVIVAAAGVGTDGLRDRTAVSALIRAVIATIAKRGQTTLGDKTILDALIPSVDALDATERTDAVGILDEMLAAVDAAIDAMTPRQSGKGRAAWLRERSVGKRDPGMVAYRMMLAEARVALGRGGSPR